MAAQNAKLSQKKLHVTALYLPALAADISSSPTPEDLETSMRLEVSGSDEGSQGALNARLRLKLEQASRGDSNIPAIATVVGFATRRIQSADVKAK